MSQIIVQEAREDLQQSAAYLREIVNSVVYLRRSELAGTTGT
jgi:hypothetical protein